MKFKYPLIEDASIELITKSIQNARDSNVREYEDHREKLKDFYAGFQTEGEYLGDYGFVDIKTRKYFADLPWMSTNITKQVINRISMCYKDAPLRTVQTKEGTELENDSYNQMIAEHPEFDLSMKELEFRHNLLNNVLFRPVYDTNAQQFLFFIETDFTPFFHEGDPLHPVAYDIPIKMDTTNVYNYNDQTYLFVNDEFYFYHKGGGEPIADEGLGDIKNPYGILPLVDFSDEAVDTYWSLGAKGLVEGNQAFNIMMMNALYAFHFQCFDQPWITGGNADEIGKMQMGPKKIIFGPEGANFGLLQYSVDFNALSQFMIYVLNMALNPYNVTANWEDTGNIASGVALKIKNLPLLEARESAIKHFRVKESWLYDVMRAMINYHGGELGYKQLPDKTNVVLDFVDPQFPVTQQEEDTHYTWLFQNNLASKIDYLKEQNPDLDDESAEKEYQRIVEQNRKLIGLGTPGATAGAIQEGLQNE